MKKMMTDEEWLDCVIEAIKLFYGNHGELDRLLEEYGIETKGRKRTQTETDDGKNIDGDEFKTG